METPCSNELRPNSQLLSDAYKSALLRRASCSAPKLGRWCGRARASCRSSTLRAPAAHLHVRPRSRQRRRHE